MSQSGRTGRPNHMEWYGFEKVYTTGGRSAAKCNTCFETLQNTGRNRLMKHKERCELLNGLKPAKRKKLTNELDEVDAWIDPQNAEWRGYRQSELPNSKGIYFAQCKKCLGVVEADFQSMGYHTDNCSGKPSVIAIQSKDHDEDTVFAETLKVEDDEATGQEEHLAEEGEETEIAEEENIEEFLDVARPVPLKKPKVTTPSVKVVKKVIAATPPSSSGNAGCASPCRNCNRGSSKFAEIGRIWAMKLDDLPLEQALGIEKKMSDMLYEAMMTNLQAKKAPKRKIEGTDQ